MSMAAAAFTAWWPATPLPDYLMMAGVVLVGACLQGIGGIGFAMFSAPVAGLFFPSLAPGPLLALGGSVSLLAALRERRSIDWRMAGVTLLGRVTGTAAAGAVLLALSARMLTLMYGSLLLAAVAASYAGWRVQPTRRSMAAAGLVSGLMGTITSAGAPPFAIVMQRLDPARLRATVGCILAAGGLVSLGLLTAVGRFGAPQLALSASLAPWMVAGFLLSGPLTGRVSSGQVRHLLLGLAGLGAAGILVKALLGAAAVAAA